jgi:N-methylhydantoinase A
MPLRMGIDVGGTFTDLVVLDEERGSLERVKVPSVPSAPERGVAAALDALRVQDRAREIALVTHATTLATNALLGQLNLELPRVALLTTEGFRDVLEIGRQNRSDVYDLFVRRPRPLVDRCDRIGVRERVDARGDVLVALDDDAIREAVEHLRGRDGVESLAISFLHAYANGAHERRMGDAVKAALPDVHVSLSSEVDPAFREYERTSTTVVNAARVPVVRGYLERLATVLRERRVHAPFYVMQSSGGMAAARAVQDRPAAIIESGPASGVIGAAFLARTLGIADALSFDMGGTTAKAGTIAGGETQVTSEFEVAGRTHSGRAVRGSGYPVRFPFVDLAEVSAGGGTIAYVDDGGALRVGPLSAGADPGPACYGRSTRPTVTDANVVLGRLNQRALLGGTMPIDALRARAAIDSLLPALGGLSRDALAAGIVALIDDAMARSLRIVTIERGWDPRDFTLIAFGGGGPLHASALAAALGIGRIMVPPAPGLFSAFGLLAADVTAVSVRSIVEGRVEPGPSSVDALFRDAEERGRASMRLQGVADEAVRLVREVEARYAGQSFELTVPARAPFDEPARSALIDAFHDKHERVYGYASRDERVELVNVRSTAVGSLPKPALPAAESSAPSEPAAGALLERRDVFFAECGRVATPVYRRDHLQPGNWFDGPAIVEEYDATTLVHPGWRADVDAYGDLVLAR